MRFPKKFMIQNKKRLAKSIAGESGVLGMELVECNSFIGRNLMNAVYETLKKMVRIKRTITNFSAICREPRCNRGDRVSSDREPSDCAGDGVSPSIQERAHSVRYATAIRDQSRWHHEMEPDRVQQP
jgi:hypothetical protein